MGCGCNKRSKKVTGVAQKTSAVQSKTTSATVDAADMVYVDSRCSGRIVGAVTGRLYTVSKTGERLMVDRRDAEREGGCFARV